MNNLFMRLVLEALFILMMEGSGFNMAKRKAQWKFDYEEMKEDEK